MSRNMICTNHDVLAKIYEKKEEGITVNKYKSIIAFGLVLVFMLGVLVGCGSSKKQEPTTSTSDTPSSEGTTNENTNVGEKPTPGNPKLPLTDKKVTFKVWKPMVPEAAQVVGSFDNVEALKELEVRTGIDIEWISPTSETEQNYSIMIASNELPDIIYDAVQSFYPGGAGKAVKDGIYLDVTELVKKYAPNYQYLRETDETFRKDTVTDDGIMPGFYGYFYGKPPIWGGFVVRQDWLDELGLKPPVTYDDWYIVLKEFKEKKNAEAPFFLFSAGVYPSNDLLAGYDVASGFYQVRGKVKFGPMEEGYKEYLTMLNKWYREGLVNKDFMTNKSPFYNPDANFVATGKSGIFWTASVLIPVYKQLSGNEKYALTAIPTPVKHVGDKVSTGWGAGMGGNAGKVASLIAITKACKNPELAAKWIDYQYSPEGRLLMNYGIEGKTYTMVDGKPKFTDLILHNPEGLTPKLATFKYLDTYSAFVDKEAEWQWTEEVHTKNYRIWEQVMAEEGWQMPLTLSLTEEEGREFANIMSPINTYVNEMTLKFIIGEEALDKFDAFVAKLKELNIDKAIAIQQAALDRYNARK